jgi:hypothetical protein
VRQRVRRPVSLAAVRRRLALPTRDTRVSSLLAPREVADSGQLDAKALMLRHVQHSVRLVAVQRHSAPGALVQDRPVLRLGPTRRVLALSDVPLITLNSSEDVCCFIL